MCGIVGYISSIQNPNSLELGLESLKSLEYRGYDSAGLAFWDQDKKIVTCIKAVGKIACLQEKLNSNGSLAANPVVLHTRWATHGKVTEVNAHPHCDCNKNIWVVHNGIIENYKALKTKLEEEGHKFISETDTEVIAHLIESYFHGSLEEAVRETLGHLEGTYGLVVISRDDPLKIVTARLSSPLLIGLGKGEFLVASDPAAVVNHTKKVIYFDDREIGVVRPDNFFVIKEKKPVSIEWTPDDVGKAGFPHFMLKEIMEQPESLENCLRGRLFPEEGTVKLGGLESVTQKLRNIRRVYIAACGTARHAGLIGEYLLEEYAGILTKVEAGSEFRYRESVLDKNTALLAISQSGETADTLAAIVKAKENNLLTLGITNVTGSTQSRETEAGVYIRSGPEIGVASTKAFTSQIATLALVTLFFARQRQLSLTDGHRIVEELSRITELAKVTLKNDPKIKELAEKYQEFDNFFFVGRKFNFPIALEGALKLKETAYIHAEGRQAGELKHGDIALISSSFPSVCLATNDSVYEKMVSNIEEIKARKGPIIAIATEGNSEITKLADDVIFVPKTLEMLSPILNVIPLQLFAYHMAVLRGCDVDKPRNLAKSVTVE